ncbi:dolichyl-diphosphooligosaccharide--protein glycosyltransferase subunit STT3A [Ixodes scapularis]
MSSTGSVLYKRSSWWVRMNPDKQETLLKMSILSMAAVLSFVCRLFSVLRFESVIHEFDPYFNYRTTRYLAEEGFYSFHNWFDDRAWYPLGRIIGGTIYPGLMVTSAALYHALQFLHITVDIRNVCVFLAPFFSSLTTLVTFLLTKELRDTSSGLVAAAMISIVPGYISRSVAGSYDNEGIAIFCMLLTYYMWIKAVKTGAISWAALCGLAYFYMVSSWGGYVFLINLIPLHVLALMATGRFSHRIYTAYSTLYVLGTLLSMQISFVGFQPVQSSEHMAALGVFGLCQLHAFVDYVRSKLPREQFELLFRTVVLATAGVTLAVGGVLTVLGKISPWTGRFYSLLDPSYAKNNIPIIASVSEHQPTSWSSFYFDLQLLVFMFPVGLYFCFSKLTDANIFIILYGITSIYFACLSKLNEEFPGSLRVKKLEAMQLEALEKYEEAAQCYESLLGQEEANAVVHKRRVALLLSQNQVAEAIRELSDYLKRFMGDQEAWLQLSGLYLREQDLPRAAFCLEELILCNPHNHLYYQRYAEVQYTIGNFETMELARAYFAQAVKLNPNNIRALYGLFLASSHIASLPKCSVQKKKDNQRYAAWASQQITRKYQERQCEDSQVKLLEGMLTSLQIN